MTQTKSTCCYCGVGCGVLITTEDGSVTAVRGDPAHPANSGRLCTKGATLHKTLPIAARALHPQLRTARAAPLSQVSWDTALDHAAERFAAIVREHGPDSVAFYISGQLLTEDYYAFNKLAKGLIGTNNIDSNSRLCMSSAVSGYKRTLGSDAPPACYEDIDEADCLFIAGSNTAYAHPVLFRRIEDARNANAALKIIVVDPRRTDTAAAADLHLQINPGTDVMLFNAMLHVMLAECWLNDRFIENHTRGFAELAQIAAASTTQIAAATCGVAAQDIVLAALWFACSHATLSLYCQGLNQSTSGSDKNAALINLHLATGQIGRAGAGPFSLTGQPNAMGGREVGGMANLLSAHRDLASAADRAEIARLWGVTDVPAQPGKTAVELFEAIGRGEIKAVWIACTNPAQSLPDQDMVRAALARAEFVVVQEAAAHTDTTPFADLLLPAATWSEKEGTVTNSERRITRVRAAVTPPGEARADWDIAVGFARRLGPRLGRRDTAWLFPYRCAEDLFDEHRATTAGRDLDITGLSYALLEQRGPQQWPFKPGASTGQARLYTDARFATADGRANFVAAPYTGVAEPVDSEYPLHLSTGRLRDQWHGMSRTGTLARLYAHEPAAAVVMHATDMRERQLADGDLVEIRSRRGRVVMPARAGDDMRQGQVFIAMHWGSRFLNSAGANALMAPVTDPHSRQPELKHAAVTVMRLSLPWRMTVLRRQDGAYRIRDGMPWVAERPGIEEIMERARPLLARFEFAALSLVGRDQPVVELQVAATTPPAPELLAAVDRAFALDDDAHAMAYHDFERGVSKRILFEGDRVAGVRLAGDTVAHGWLQALIAGADECGPLRGLLAAPIGAASGIAPRGRVICNCMDVAEDKILSAIAAGAGVAALQAQLRCGTECGSCLPELRRLCAEARAGAVAVENEPVVPTAH